nr:Retrovirus-related Pol polyprotein from transposon opus [Ipomoea batatas]
MRIEQSNLPIYGHQFLLKNGLPKFDGKDPYVWIIQSQEFFECDNVSHEQRLSCVYFMVHGEALEWFHWMKSNALLRSWDDFLEQVKFRLDPVYFEDFTVQFPKLYQAPTMTAYQAEYEKLSPLTPNEGQHHEVGYREHPIEYSNTKFRMVVVDNLKTRGNSYPVISVLIELMQLGTEAVGVYELITALELTVSGASTSVIFNNPLVVINSSPSPPSSTFTIKDIGGLLL